MRSPVPSDPLPNRPPPPPPPPPPRRAGRQLGLNYPLWRQYLTWLGAVFQGNLGTSYLNHESVTHIIATGFPVDRERVSRAADDLLTELGAAPRLAARIDVAAEGRLS